MEKPNILRRIVPVLLILTLMTSLFVNLPLSVSAEDEGLTGGQSNIVNGSFEDPSQYREDAWNASSTTGYKYAPQGEVPGWNTTSTTSNIEIGWMNKDGTSPHMVSTIKTEIIEGVGASDGWQFAETVANETSTIYQSLSLTKGEEYKWTVCHRGREGVDTLALFIVDDAGVDYVKTAKNSSDHFNKIVDWMKASPQSVATPAAGEISQHTVYTTALKEPDPDDPNLFMSASSGSFFSFKEDIEHTVEFKIYLISTAKADWGEYTATYTSDSDKNILFAMTGFKSASKSSTSGNLVDSISFTDSKRHNLLKNPGFEDYELSNSSSGYYMANAANSSSPASNIGWSTTASDYKIEIGSLRGGKDAYGLGVKFNTVVYNPPSIREGEQFAELNADQESSLYQIVNTDPGKMYKWSLSHRGRSGLDTMALIIGPAQFDEQGNSILPKKTSATARDQLMQIVDWLYSQTEMAIDIPEQGCSEKIKLYSPKFDNNGGWALSENIFSWQKDTYHTEEWSVWIISSINDKWHDYGEIDETATYNYNYIVPKEQEKSIFGFVSHDSTLADGTKNITYGNLLDNIAFKEYYYARVEVAMNDTHGKAQIIVNENNDFIHDEKDDESLKSGWALIGSSFTVHITEAEGDNHRPFVGAYINGTFVPSSLWTEKNGEYTYTFSNIQSATKVNIIFAAKQIYYDSRSPYEYKHNPNDSETGPEVPMKPIPGQEPTYISHAPQADDGWKFMGWKYISPSGNKVYMFDAVHKVKLVGEFIDDTSALTFSVYPSEDATEATVSGIPYNEGITFLAEWKYRQRVIAKTFDKTENQYLESTVGGTVDINVSFGADEEKINYPNGATDDEAVRKELYASSDETYVTVTAKHRTGFSFNGWYDKNGKLVSRNTSYAYKVPDGDTVELYAYFEPHGLNLTIDCDVFGDSEDLNKYFKVNCTFSNLRANQLYIVSNLASDTENIIINGERVYNPTMIRADENGNATAAIYMKHGDSGTFVFLPENCTYTIQADGVSSEGFSVRGEVTSESLKEETIENLIFYKASQTAIIDDGKHYDGIDDGKDKITITKNSSYTFQATTKYTPSIYEGLNASLCFYDSNGIATEFAANTRILMIDLTDGQYPNYYSYIVTGSVSEIALTEFTVLGTTDSKFALQLQSGSMVTENLVFVVDYVGTGDSAAGGKVALVYDNVNSEIKNIINPKRKTADIDEDTTGITATAGNSGKAASVGPFVIDVGITESSPAVNTTYKEDGDSEYAVQLSVDGGTLPDGSYAVIDGIKYYSNNGYIKIPSLIAGNYKLNVYSPIPIELSDGKVKFNVTLLEEISASPAIPVEISQEVNFTCVEVAIDADVSDKVLNPGNVSGFDIKLEHKNLDEVKLTVTKKGSGEALISNVNVPCPNENNSVTVTPPNGFTAVSGETYIFTFVGYLDGVAVTEDTCCVVGGYVIK